MDKKIVLSLSGPFSFEQLYSPHFLWFKINSSWFQAYLGQGPNIRGGGVPRPQTTPRGRPTTSTSQPTRLDINTMNTGPQKGDEFGAVCVAAKNKKMQTKFSCSKCNVRLCVDPCSGRTTHKCIFEDCLTVRWKKLNTKRKYWNFTITSSVPAILLRGNIPQPNICTETRTQG
jgi:hypothetical protein